MRRALALTTLLVAFFALRLPSLRTLPLYSDEGLGLWRAERVLEGSLTRGAGEGKPLHAWMIAAAIALPGDDIVSARAAHVAAGALLLLALWDVTRRISPAAAWTAAALWLVLPFPAIFERTVTPDVPLAAAGMAAFACALRVVDPQRSAGRGWRWALLGAGAAATFVKMPIGLLAAATPLLAPLTLLPGERAEARSRLRPYAIALAATIAGLIAIVAARAALGWRPLGFGLHEIGRKIAVTQDVRRAPVALVESLRRTGEYASLYLGAVATLLLVAGVLRAWLGRDRLPRVATGFALAWTALVIGGADNLSAHYLLAALPFFVVGMAAATPRSPRSGVGVAMVLAVLLGVAIEAWPLHRALWSDPSIAPLASTERQQYVEGTWAGYGIPEAARWIDQRVAGEAGDAVVVTLHLADYERLRLYAREPARSAIVQLQVDERHNVPVSARIDRARSLLETGKRVLVVVGSQGRFERRWREAFPRAVLRASLPRPAGDRAVEVWELAPTD